MTLSTCGIPMNRWLGWFLLLAAVAPAHARQCMEAGTTTSYTIQGVAELYFVDSQPEGDYQFALPEGAYEHDSTVEPDRVQFRLDGIVYGFRTRRVADLVDGPQTTDPTEILPRYAAASQRAAKESNDTYQVLYELDRTRRPPYRSTPAMFFLRWRLGTADPHDDRGVYYVSTVNVTGRLVATFAGLVQKSDQLSRVLARLDRFATSYRLLEADDACPAGSDSKPAFR
jgi:hypothetical protein